MKLWHIFHVVCLRTTIIFLAKVGKFNFMKNVFAPFLIILSCALVVQSRQASLAALMFIGSYIYSHLLTGKFY